MKCLKGRKKPFPVPKVLSVEQVLTAVRTEKTGHCGPDWCYEKCSLKEVRPWGPILLRAAYGIRVTWWAKLPLVMDHLVWEKIGIARYIVLTAQSIWDIYLEMCFLISSRMMDYRALKLEIGKHCKLVNYAQRIRKGEHYLAMSAVAVTGLETWQICFQLWPHSVFWWCMNSVATTYSFPPKLWDSHHDQC